jgi:hypothetical protein
VPGLQYPGSYSTPPLVPDTVDPVVITTIVLPDLVSGQPYSATIQAIGGKPPYGFGLIAGTLPPGLFLSSTGVVSGIPVMPGVEITPAVLKVAVVDTPYSEKVSIIEGETRTYTFRTVTFVVEGCVPPCLSVGADGSIGGIPMKVGTFPLSFLATDGSGTVSTRLSYTLVVRPKP